MLNFFVTLQALVSDRIERDDKGATLVEYGLITGLIIAIAIAGMAVLGTGVNAMFTEVGADVGAAF
jgi:pilus assembly protein Flp/PilA